MAVKIGTSGWQYPHWRETFYPEDLPTSRWLEFYARSFDTVEVNNVFYRLPAADVFERWRQATPDHFEMAVKASGYLTHNKRLREPSEPIARFVERALGLGEKLGPVLLQLPPTMRAEPGRLDEALACFPDGVRVAVEARHDSWDRDEVWEVLAAHGAAWCVADAPWRRWPLVPTADWGYLRFHEGVASPRPCYGRRALGTWAERIARTWPASADVYAFFNNDTCACAPHDARRFAGLCRRAGLQTTRVPGRGAVTLRP
ncbi:MAG TPA: DUF72 domain-containing protein [Acidimicrobiales bacterium]|nr:DUF72 domain-containing protein [Acidimicrobiales bacterium]